MNSLYQNAIKSIESSGGNYGLLGPVTNSGDRAYGAYQVMGANIPEWTKKHLGQSMTPEQFLADKDAQDAVFNGQFGSYVNKYGNPQDAASAWFTGGPMSTGANKRDILGTSGSGYVGKFNKFLGANGGDGVSAINSAAGIQPSNPGALTSAFADPSKDSGALSANNTLGPGVLFSAGAGDGGVDKAGVIGSSLTGMGSALAGISSPAQANALTQAQVAMQKAPNAANKLTIGHVDPKTGMALGQVGNKVIRFQAFTPKPDDDTYTEQYNKDNAKGMVELGTGLSSAARDAVNQQTTVNELRNVFSNDGVYQGTGGDWVQGARKLYSAMGFGDPKAVADGDMASALSNKLALQLVNNGGTKLLPGSFSDSDRKFVTQMATSLNNSKDANIRLLDIYDRANGRVMEAEKLRQDHEAANGGVIKPSFRTELGTLSSKWATEDQERSKAEAAAPKSAPGKPALPKGVKSIQLVQ
jgi:hypothetical protein